MTSDDFSKRLKNIEDSLVRVFPSQVDLNWARVLVGQQELPLRPESFDRINEPAWELIRRGGKRWRPLVLILTHELLGGAVRDIADLSLLVELPHNGSLIVDDIEDKAEFRRGGRAIHLLYGLDMAVNTGNFLYFAPTYVVERSSLDEKAKYSILTHYLRVMRRLHIGQGLDIQWHNDRSFLPSRDEYLQMCRFKTGALSRLSAEIGAAAAGADDQAIDSIGGLWEDIGVGFQILDDVLNLTKGNPGKMRGDDLVEGKKSLPILCHAALSEDNGARVLELIAEVAQARTQGQPVESFIDQAIEAIRVSGGIAQARRIAEDLLAAAGKRLKANYPEHPARQGMENLLSGFLEGMNP